jgi:uncharacterized protein
VTASLTHPPVRDRAEIFSLLRAHRAEIHDFGVRQIGVFGSFVRDEQNAESDVDLLIEFEPSQKTFKHFMGLSFFLEELLGRRVELVTREYLSPYIGPHILREVQYVALAD